LTATISPTIHQFGLDFEFSLLISQIPGNLTGKTGSPETASSASHFAISYQ
jgi:hypothetical protein